MPTPVGHALGGVVAGCLVVGAAALAGGRGRRAAERVVGGLDGWRGLALLAGVGVLADADLLVGAHRGVSHSAGAALAAAAAAAALAPGARTFAAAVVGAAFGSHVLLDWLGTDPGAPHGIMVWWPLTREYFLSDAHLFLRVCRDYDEAACWRNNLLALARELALLAPLALAAAFGARRALRRPSAARAAER